MPNRSALSKSLLPLSFVLFAAFAFFTLLVRLHLFESLDFVTTVKLQYHLSRAFDTPFSVLSVLGSVEVISFALLATAIHFKNRFWPIFSGYVVGTIIELLGKTVVFHPGPPFRFFHYDLAPVFPSNYLQTSYSYPSGHSFRIVFIAFICAFATLEVTKSPKRRWLTVGGLCIVCSLMLISRVALGEHWPTDVVGGSLLGLSLAVGSASLSLKKKFFKPTASRSGQ